MSSYDAFPAELHTYLQEIEAAKRADQHHDHRRHLFLSFLHRALSIKPSEIELEKGIRAVKLKGYIDALYEDIVFEFKRNLDAERETGLEELDRYLRSLPPGPHAFGVLTDGLTFEVYSLTRNKLALIESINLRTLGANDPHAVLLWFDAFLFSQKGRTPTSEDFVRKFGAHAPVFAAATDALHQMWVDSEENPTTQTKYREWTSLLSKVYGSAGVGTPDLFVRHTYLSLLAKILAYVCLPPHAKPRAEKELIGVVNGESFRRHGLVNLSELDFFTWAIDGPLQKRTVRLLRGFVQHLESYDLGKINEDLLKELYQVLVDPATRHDLGEYYTPDWLAQVTLEEAGYKGKGRLLDPSCGSGTFLFIAIREARQRGLRGEALIKYALSSIVGVDVHPLAVTTARVNYALALAQDLEKYPDEVAIPVYMADSLIAAPRGKRGHPIEILVSAGVRHKKIAKKDESFVLPVEIASSPQLHDELVERMTEYARHGEEGDELRAGFRKFLQKHKLEQTDAAFWMHNLSLMIKLVREGRDTIWGFILRNSYRPILLARQKFHFVVGNPPWLSYRYIQDPRYQKEVKALVFKYGLLKSTEVNLFNVIDTSTIFYEFCSDHYVAKGGTLAFVMPKSVLTGAKQHKEFQRRAFRAVIDLERVSPLFNVPSCVLVRDSGAEPIAKIPEQSYSGTLPKKNLTWDNASHFLQVNAGAFTPKTFEVPKSPYFDLFIQGATIVPQAFWFVSPTSRKAVVAKRMAIETDSEIKKTAKKPWNTFTVSGRVEREFLFCTLLTKDLLPFGWRKLHLMVLPVIQDQRGPHLINKAEALERDRPGLSDWLADVELIYRQSKKETTKMSLYQRLDYQRTLTGQKPAGNFKVLHNRSGTHLNACVIDATKGVHIDESGIGANGFFAFATTHYRETENEDEAHYLCAFLNSPSVDAAIKPHQTKGLFGERDIYRRPFEILPIPMFDPKNTKHRKLAEQGKKAASKVAELNLTRASGSVGKQRNQVRDVVKVELANIDGLVHAILAEAGTVLKETTGTRAVTASLFD